MDGNGRWAKKRHRPRSLGHQAGVKAVRRTIEFCAKNDIPCLTLFAFSSENWSRPELEVKKLMELFLRALQKEVQSLHENNIKVCFIGDLAPFSPELRSLIEQASQLTQNNSGLMLNIAINYGGRWDITQAAKKMGQQIKSGLLDPEYIDENSLSQFLSMQHCQEPDLFIRTGGEIRISNFLLWQLAYTELYFTDILWPDFNEEALLNAMQVFASRDRRFGNVKENT